MNDNLFGLDKKDVQKYLGDLIELAKLTVNNPNSIFLIAIGVAYFMNKNQRWELKEDTNSDLLLKDDTVDSFCKRNPLLCKRVRPNDLLLDTFPFEIPGLITKELGQVYLSDLLIGASLAGLSKGTINALSELIGKLK